ncbi:MAG: LolA family protein [Deltaproteobacteria bacterium]
MKLYRLHWLIGVCSLLSGLLAGPANAANPADAADLLRRMESAYERVKDYRALVEVVLDGGGAGLRKEEFLYTFKKPRQVRIDYKTPQPGTLLIFPDKDGKVLLRPWGWRFLDHHLAPDSFLLPNPSGQRIDQTDFGLLIKNMARSMDGGRRGPLEILEEEQYLRIRVLAEDHFREGKVTKYQFTIDKATWFASEVEERSADGVLERRITFKDLAVNTGVPDSFFRPDGD